MNRQDAEKNLRPTRNKTMNDTTDTKTTKLSKDTKMANMMTHLKAVGRCTLKDLGAVVGVSTQAAKRMLEGKVTFETQKSGTRGRPALVAVAPEN
jgi:predicted ArsR family transcriptional regulator